MILSGAVAIYASHLHLARMACRRAHQFEERSIAMASWQQRIAGLASGLSLFLLAGVVPAAAQSGACTLVPDKRNPNDKILRCGTELTITPAPGTVYRPGPAGADGLPTSVQLDKGALLIEFNPKQRHEFQMNWAETRRPWRSGMLPSTARSSRRA
jgi:hypothetical protein